MYVLFVVKYDSNEQLDAGLVTDPAKSDPEIVHKAFNNEIYRNALRTWLPFLNKRGFLDTLLPQAPVSPFMMKLQQQLAQAAVAKAMSS
jgi:hypothetical protein